MISVGSEVIKKFEAITLRSYGGEKRKLIPGQLFQGEWLLEAQILTIMSLSGQPWIVKSKGPFTNRILSCSGSD